METIEKDGIKARLDSGECVSIPLSYHHIEYGYATTIHKGQGMTVDTAKILIDSKYWDKHLSFVALTRHRNRYELYVDRLQHKDMDALHKTLSRTSTQDNVIDWPLDFSIRKGFNPDSMLNRAIQKIANINHNIKEKWNYLVHYESSIKQQQTAKLFEDRQKIRIVAKDVADYIDIQVQFSWLNLKISQEAKALNVEKAKTPSYERLYVVVQT